jgi:hypothetical protein
MQIGRVRPLCYRARHEAGKQRGTVWSSRCSHHRLAASRRRLRLHTITTQPRSRLRLAVKRVWRWRAANQPAALAGKRRGSRQRWGAAQGNRQRCFAFEEFDRLPGAGLRPQCGPRVAAASAGDATLRKLPRRPLRTKGRATLALERHPLEPVESTGQGHCFRHHWCPKMQNPAQPPQARSMSPAQR